MHAALKTATELGIEIGIFNSPGWSQSGGPWVKPEQAMRYLASVKAEVSGGKQVEVVLAKPDKSPVDPSFFHRIQVLLHSFFRDIPGDPIPINGSLYFFSRIHKTGLKCIFILPISRKRDQQRKAKQCFKQRFSHDLFFLRFRR